MNDGFLLLHKEKNITSRALVNRVCCQLNTKKVGHLGTLDPMAEGLMILAVGKALKIAYLLNDLDKEYIAEAEFGYETDTLDAEGSVIKKQEYNLNYDEVKKVLMSFNKEYYQTVPKYSAKKVKGKKLYEYARQNIDVDLPKTKVKISNIELLYLDDNKIKFKCRVTSGTYIRSLIRDIGKSLGICMTMTSLLRISQGPFLLENASKLENLQFLDMKVALFNKNIVKAESLKEDIRHGKILKDQYGSNPIFVDDEGNILAIYECYKEGFIKPKKVLI